MKTSKNHSENQFLVLSFGKTLDNAWKYTLLLICALGICILSSCSKELTEEDQIFDPPVSTVDTSQHILETDTVKQHPYHHFMCGSVDVPHGERSHSSPVHGLAGQKSKFWSTNQVIKVEFMEGDPEMHRKVETFANIWSQYGDISFDFGEFIDSDIRITFDTTDGYWSKLGTDALKCNEQEATMNLGFKDFVFEGVIRAVVLHEFGHALGLIHEHNRADNPIPWDRDAVYKYYEEVHKWSKKQVDHNVLSTRSNTLHSSYDRNSIMHYPVINDLTIGDFEIGWNDKLSSIDKEFIGHIYGEYKAEQANEDTWYVSYSGKTKWRFLKGSKLRKSDLAFGDFNGDGSIDVFWTYNGTWYVSYSGRDEWHVLRNSNLPTSKLKFGDFDGDGKTDVFWTSNGKWKVSWAGKTTWKDLRGSNLSSKSLKFGDFDGDGKTDAFWTDRGKWKVSWACQTKWKDLRGSNVESKSVELGDFNGDGKTDVFWTDRGKWKVSWAGKTKWKDLRSSNLSSKSLEFGDFDGDGKTDAFWTDRGKWKVSWACQTKWKDLRSSNLSSKSLRFGDFDADGQTDVFWSNQ